MLVAKRKKHQNTQIYSKVKNIIEKKHQKPIRLIAKDIGVSETTIRRTFDKNLQYKSSVKKRGHYMSEIIDESRLGRYKRLKHPVEQDSFSDKKKLKPVPKVNQKE